MSRRAKQRLLVLTAILLVTAGVGVVAQWRLKAVALKLRGELPSVSWRQIGSLFTLGVAHDPRQDLDAGFVTLSEDGGEEPCPILWATPFGDLWGTFHDRPDLELMVREQLVDRIYHNASVSVGAGDVVIDVGGHLGTFTHFALQQGVERVVVFEPEARNIECFKRSFAAELHTGRVVLVEAAAWRSATVLHFRGDGLTGQVNSAGEIEVRAVTIDDTVEKLALASVDFIKMDIEGAEVDALIGAQRTLARFAPEMALSIYHHPDHPREVPRVARAAHPPYRLTMTREFAYLY